MGGPTRLWRRAWRPGTITPWWRSSTAWRPRCTVQHLPGDQRRVVELAYFHGLTCREVALAAGIPEGTVKSRLRLALTKLETMLDRQLLESS